MGSISTTKDRQRCRWAALSLSNIASVFLPDVLARSTSKFDHALVAVSSTKSKDAAKSWLNTHQIPTVGSLVIYSSWEEMLEEGDFDIVYISSPHSLHYEHVSKALSCSRNVLVEKPATMTARQYERCISIAREKGLVLMEAMWTRYLPATQFLIKELLPKIGRVRRVYADFSFPIVSPDMSHESRFLDKKSGAGSLLDQGCYALTWTDIALNAVNPAETKVRYSSSMSVPNISGDIDDINTVILEQQDAIGIVTTSMTLPGSSDMPFYDRLQARKHAPSIRIEAEKAAIAIPFPPIRPETIMIAWYDRSPEVEETFTREIDGWGIWYQADLIASSVLAGLSEVIGAEESLRILGWMDTAREMAGIKYPDSLEAI